MKRAASEIYSWLRSRGIRPESITIVLRAPTSEQACRLELEILRDEAPSCLDRVTPASNGRTFRLSGLRVLVTAAATNPDTR